MTFLNGITRTSIGALALANLLRPGSRGTTARQEAMTWQANKGA